MSIATELDPYTKISELPADMGNAYEQSLDVRISHSNGRTITFVWKPEPETARLRDGVWQLRLVAADGSLWIPGNVADLRDLDSCGHQDITNLSGALGSVASSRYSNTARCNPFTDEVWDVVPSYLDVGYVGQLPLFD